MEANLRKCSNYEVACHSECAVFHGDSADSKFSVWHQTRGVAGEILL